VIIYIFNSFFDFIKLIIKDRPIERSLEERTKFEIGKNNKFL